MHLKTVYALQRKLVCLPHSPKLVNVRAKRSILHEVVYTDGSYKKKMNKCSIGLWYEHEPERSIGIRIMGSQESHRAELAAIYIALAKSTPRLLWIFTDSLSSMQMINQSYYSLKDFPKYQCLLDDINSLIDDRSQRTVLVKVPAHNGIRGNVLADKLAKSADEHRYMYMPDVPLGDVLKHQQHSDDIEYPT
jgi:ribonuclease HI